MLILSCLLGLAPVAAPSASPVQASLVQRPLLGGFRAVDVNDAQVRAAASFAAESVEGALAEVTSAERQTVAGANYRLTFTTTDGRSYRAEVFHGLDRSYAVRSIEEVGDHHGEAEEPAEEGGESDE